MEVLHLIDFFHSYRNVCPSLLLEGPQTLPLCSSVNSSREYDEYKEFLERYWQGKPEVLAETLFPYLCMHHKSHKHWPGLGERLKYYNSVLCIKILFAPHREKSVAFMRGSRLMYRETVFIVGILWNFNTECAEEWCVLLLQQVVHTLTTGL